MMIRAEKTQIPRAIIPRVTVDVIHVQRNPACSRIPFAPSADAAFVAC